MKQRTNDMPRHRLIGGTNSGLAPLLLLLVTGLSAAGCSSDGDRPPPASSPMATATPDGGLTLTSGCIDEDGDGFGIGCKMGRDCDDHNPEVTSDCLCAELDTPGCSCTDAGAQVACGKVYSRVGDQVVCGDGISTCDGEAWGECIINGAVTLKSMSSSLLRPMSLGAPSACSANPCDPRCKTFTDTTTGLSLPSDTGVVATASGVTLPGSEAILVPGVNGTGYDCTDAAYPPSGGCAHHVCKTGAALNQWCDGTAPVQVPLTIFTDDFSGTTGWTLGTNWAIGSATSSSGQSSGNADPATDSTAGTNDNRIAGTVIGGNIGGTPTTLLTDAFGNLNNWTQTGDGRWSAKNRESSTGYAAGGSGNKIGHADNCTNSCTLALTSGLDLTPYSAATLSFQYYLGLPMVSGDYLKAYAYNGSTWNQIMGRLATADSDGKWHVFSWPFDSSYLINGFKVRFVTHENATTRSAEVDDVSVTATALSVTSYLTSPVFNTATSVGNVTLTFKRWLNVNAEFVGKLEIYNGSSWVALYASGGVVSDSAWQPQSYDITSYKSANTQLRFSYTGTSASKLSGWNIDDVQVVGTQWTTGTSLCVHQICQTKPACCTTGWTLDCVDALTNVCQVECAVDTGHNNSCIACFHDPTLTVDVDGDGQSPATGDCRECDPGISSGAYDLPGDHIDQNCDGIVDNEVVTCDSALAAGGDAWAHAKALGLCKVASGNSWGVVSAAFVKADGVTACTDAKQYEIMSAFGSGNLPVEGSKMAVFSSGTARTPSESGYVAPNGTNSSGVTGYNANTSSTPKYAVPSASGCSAGTAGYDSCGLKLVIRAPTNANSFGYNFNFFTSEYPEWLCTAYNDSYVAYYEGSLNTQANKNISFDSANNPVSVNNGLFSIPGVWPPLATGLHPLLNGTGFDGVCTNPSNSKWTLPSICGGSTGWLQTTAPVKPGEQITLTFNVWDTGDHQWDSTVLLDRFTWSTSSASIQTGHYSPGSGSTIIPPSYTPGTFTRDYDMTGVCGADYVPTWSIWSWSATTPGDSKVEFYVQAADTTAGLATAPKDALLFSQSTGPSALVGQPAVARAGSPNTQTGSAVVYDTLKANNRLLFANHVRITARLVPTTDQLQTPALGSWNLQTSCQASQ